MVLVLFASVILANIPITLTPPSVLKAEAVSNTGVVATSTAISIPSATPTSTPTVKEAVIAEFGSNSIMVRIASCESGFRQFAKDGSVLKNPHSTAKGVFQVMYSIHNAAALKMGMDVLTTEGNIAYARVLYDTQGTVPWNASKYCWG